MALYTRLGAVNGLMMRTRMTSTFHAENSVTTGPTLGCTARDMGNTFVQRHRLHFLCWFLPPPEGGGTCSAVDPRARDHGMNSSAPIVAQLAQQHQPKVHFVAPQADGLDAHRHPDQGLPEEVFAPAPLDLPIAAHTPSGIRRRIAHRRQPLGVTAARALIMLR